MDREKRLQDDALPDDATAKPWPVLTDAQRADATERMRQEAVAALEVAGIKPESVETDSFLPYGDLPRGELQRLGKQLDAMYERVAGMLAVPKGVNIFWGKAVILCFEKQDTFRVVEAAVFKMKAPPSLRGICHMRGPQQRRDRVRRHARPRDAARRGAPLRDADAPARLGERGLRGMGRPGVLPGVEGRRLAAPAGARLLPPGRRRAEGDGPQRPGRHLAR